MKGRLTESQKQYVLYHLGHHATISEELKLRFRFGDRDGSDSPHIRFWESGQGFDPDHLIRIDDIPVLYPGPEENTSFYAVEDNTLIFHHDLIKSAFHLLSGYDEFSNKSTDQYGRFPYKESIQHRLDIISKPLVNYYFEIILEGLELFCKKNRIPFERRGVFSNPVLMLSHDIDRIDAYHFYETAFRFKQLAGLAPSPYSLKNKIRVAFSALFHFLNPFSRKNPFWSFDFLDRSESERGIKSTYFFLEKEGKHENSRYLFSEPRIVKLLKELSGKGHEIGLHGTIQSATSQAHMDRTLKNLQASSPYQVEGIRQHVLKFQPVDTALIQQAAGLKYDASLGYAEHEGFRNSYCWPFKIYDHKNDIATEIWEVPLTIMESTLFYYRKLNLDEAMLAIKNLAKEVLKFNGVFSLLWHNVFFDELEIPGINKFYLSMLDYLKSTGMEGITGREILRRIEES